jgi:16S rRNA processing protein RimM
MGRVAGSYGVRGWVKVAPGGGVADTLTVLKEWWIGDALYTVAEARVHSGTVVARLEGITSREQALELKGAEVAVERSALPEVEAGHYYLADLVGLEVVSGQDEVLGRVEGWITNGAQDVMEVKGERRHLIPWVAAIVKQVDLEAKRIVVDWAADW